MIPGHNFIPFYNEDLFPGESFDIIDEDDNIICIKQAKYKIEELYQYYFLLGAENIVDNFVAENPYNKNLIGNPKNSLNISVFDFKDFYQKHSFKDGDYLLFEILDWTEGKYKVTALNSDSFKQKEIQDFVEHFSSCLLNVFEKHGQWLDIPEQLAYAYLACNKEYLKNPKASITEFINSTDSIQLKFIENHTLLWHPDKEEDKQENASQFLKVSSGTTESLDSILNQQAKYLSSVEVTAFIKDSLNNDITDPEEIITRMFPEGLTQFTDKAQKVSFMNFIDELIETLEEGFVKEGDQISSIRGNILQELENFYIFHDTCIKDSDIDCDLTEIEQNITYLRKILEHLNTENMFYSNDEELEQLDNLVFGVLTKLSEEIENLELE